MTKNDASPDSIDYASFFRGDDDERSLGTAPGSTPDYVALTSGGIDGLCLAIYSSNPKKLCPKKKAECKVPGHAKARLKGRIGPDGTYAVDVDAATGTITIIQRDSCLSPEKAAKAAQLQMARDKMMAETVAKISSETAAADPLMGHGGGLPSYVSTPGPAASLFPPATAKTDNRAGSVSWGGAAETTVPPGPSSYAELKEQARAEVLAELRGDQSTDGAGSAVPADLRAHTQGLNQELVQALLDALKDGPKTSQAQGTQDQTDPVDLSNPWASGVLQGDKDKPAAGEKVVYALSRSPVGGIIVYDLDAVAKLTKGERGCSNAMRTFRASEVAQAREWLEQELAKQPEDGRGLPIVDYYAVARGFFFWRLHG